MNATSKLVKAWESKNAKNAARAGGVSLMALSLAACGGSSTTTTATSTTTTDTTTTDTTTTVAPTAQTLTLTTSVDSVTGGAGDDTIQAAYTGATPAATLSVGDTVDGGAGTDTIKIIKTAAIAQSDVAPTGATVTNVEIAELISGGAIVANTSTGALSGITSMVATSTGGATLTAAATTNINSTVKAQAAANSSVDGGNNVSVTATGQLAGTITVGATTAAAGTVTVVSDGGAAGATMGAVDVTGGTTINVTQTATDHAVNTLATQGTMALTGNASTTSVSATQSAAATAAAAVKGVVNGAVTIADANAASLTAAGTITSATLNNYGNSTINSGALTTVNVSGTGGTLGVTAGALTTATVSTLALNVDSATAGAMIIDADYTTLNIAGSTAASTIANVTAAGATTVNFTGSADVTLTNNTFGAATDFNVTGTGGVTLGTTAVGAAVDFDGGAGNDSVILTNGFTQGITMGDGNDTVTYGGAAGTGGSADLGGGTGDTVVMTTAQAQAADGSAVFNSTFKNFETLRISDGLANKAHDVSGLGAVTDIELAVGGVHVASSLTSVASGSTITQLAAGTGFVVNVTNAATSVNDVINLEFSNATGAGQAIGQVTAANVETVNITTTDAGTAANTAATIDTAKLVATGATAITISGNNGLDLTNSGNTAVTSMDASGVVGNGTDDTAANLAVKFVSANVTATATVAITGGAGNDTLTGAAAIDTIVGGAGADTITGHLGQDTLTGGAGSDDFVFSSQDAGTTDSSTASADVISDYAMSSAAATGDDISIDLDKSGGTDEAINVEANGTGNGSAVGVTYTVTSGILTLSGAGASGVNTLGEWLTEASAVAGTSGDILAFEFGGDTYIFAQNGSADVLIELDGVTGADVLLEASTATVDNTILYSDVF